MNKNKVMILLVILNVLLVGICINRNTTLNRETQIVKEMTEGEYESKLTELNESHEEYALQVQTNKQKIATAISNQKVETSEDDSIDEFVTNIGKILQNTTSDATATAEDIVEGKTAYVNGEKIEGKKISLSGKNLLCYIGPTINEKSTNFKYLAYTYNTEYFSYSSYTLNVLKDVDVDFLLLTPQNATVNLRVNGSNILTGYQATATSVSASLKKGDRINIYNTNGYAIRPSLFIFAHSDISYAQGHT